jgi:predicted nucleotidyltransferase
MPKLELRPEYQEIVQRLLASHVPDSEVWAYGSRVTGHAHDGSDLDLVVRDPVEPARSQKNLATLRAAFSESDLPIRVDVFDWSRLPEDFRREIEKAHVVVWSTPPDPR